MDIKNRLKTRYEFLDYIYWNLFAAIPFIIAFIAIFKSSIIWAVVYILVFLALFLIVEYRFFCSHCPHYCQNAHTTKCLFIWGVPKYFKARPFPLTILDKSMMILGFLIIILFPVYWLFSQPLLLIIYLLSWTVFGFTLKRYECNRCIYFHCPANSVPKNLKDQFIKN